MAVHRDVVVDQAVSDDLRRSMDLNPVIVAVVAMPVASLAKFLADRVDSSWNLVALNLFIVLSVLSVRCMTMAYTVDVVLCALSVGPNQSISQCASNDGRADGVCYRTPRLQRHFAHKFDISINFFFISNIHTYTDAHISITNLVDFFFVNGDQSSISFMKYTQVIIFCLRTIKLLRIRYISESMKN